MSRVEKFYHPETGEPLLKCVPSLIENGKLCSLGAMRAKVGALAPPRWGRALSHRYLELEHISRFQGQISGYSKPVSIRLSKHHGWRCGRTETVVFSHPFVGQHQPHTHLIHRVVKSRLLIKVLTGTIQNRKTVLYLWKQEEMFGSWHVDHVFLKIQNH